MKKQSFFKKSYLWMLAACIGWQATSCTNENDPAGGNESNTVTFTVEPDYSVKTRAAGTLPTGAEALRYIMEVYDNSSNLVSDSRQVVTTTAPGTPVQFTLAKDPGKTYTVVFWADYTAEDKADVYFDTAAGGLKDISLKKTLEPAEKCQAFFGTVGIDGKGTPETTTVSLKRAVAQVNLITNNKLTGYGSVKVNYGEAEANAPASHFNALDGTATTNTVISGVVNTVDAAHTATEADPYTFHSYYVFAPKAAKSIINMVVDLCSDDAGATSTKQIKIASVPVQANYRTNITGGFGLGDNTFDVSCKEEWETPDNGIQLIWDGNILTPNGSYTFSGGTGEEATPYVIADSKDLAQLAANVNEGTDYNGKYFKLANDLDLNNKEWTPIGESMQINFKGVFDGGSHKISNLKINNTTSKKSIGLFGYIMKNWDAPITATIKNLHVNGSITNSSNEITSTTGGICGTLSGSIICNCSFEGNVSSTNNQSAGGICGQTYSSSIIRASKNYGTISSTGQGLNEFSSIGGVVGCAQSSTIEYCYNEGTITAVDYVGGITGSLQDAGILMNGCYNIGEVKSEGSHVGAILGATSDESSITDCYVAKSYTYINEAVFSNTKWPAWTAGVSADGTDAKGYWKSLGGWNATNPVYPKLWWE